MQKHLDPGESVLAAVYVQRPGTMSAGLQGGVSGAVSGLPNLGHGEGDETFASWVHAATAHGIDPVVARRTVRAAVVVTNERVLLVRRSSITGRLRGLLAAWPISDVERVEVPRNGARLTIRHADVDLPFELPTAHRFLPDVYRDLPDLVTQAQAGNTGSASSGPD